MYQFDAQINRIREKLATAKKKDRQLKVFGADSHKYFIDKPLDQHQLSGFEKEYNISLPESFKAFLLHLGNGGKSHADSAAGPFYGIYPLGTEIDELTDNPKKHLSEPVKIHPNITDEDWNELIKAAEKEDISEEEYNIAMGNMYAGILPIGSQGCTYIHGLVLNGEHQGKVVNIDIDVQKPKFTFENNFLDWYERWLDEIISEELIVDGPSWFGYRMGGSVTMLLEKYQTTRDKGIRSACLSGILAKRNIQPETLASLEKEFQLSEAEYKKTWLEILTKFNYQLAKPHLIEYCNIDLLAVFQSIYWYAKDKSAEWKEIIVKSIPGINDPETFRFCTYLLTEIKMDYGYLIVPMTGSPHEEIRKTSFYILGNLKKKADYVDAFMNGLTDPSNKVVHITLQALSGVKDRKLLPVYKKVADRFPVEQDYILSNLEQRLKEMGLTISQLRSKTM